MKSTTLSVDLAKNVFQVAVSRHPDKVAEAHRLNRTQFLRFFSKHQPALVLLEACGTAHFRARKIQDCGHEVLLLPPGQVKPYVRRNKTDQADANGRSVLSSQPRPVFILWRNQRIDKTKDRGAIIEHFDDSSVQMSMAADVALIEAYDEVIRDLELFLLHQVRKDHGHGFSLLRSIPGIGEVLALTLLYEIDDLGRFPSARDFLSYSRLVKGRHESAGKTTKSTGSKIGNVHLKWAFSEAAALFLRWNTAGRKYFVRIEKKHGKGKALSILAAKLGRAVYYMLLRKKPFDMQRFVNA